MICNIGKKFSVKILSEIDENGDISRVEQFETGFLTEHNGGYSLQFGTEPTWLKISGDKTAILYKGNSSDCKMYFEEGKTTKSVYITEYFPIEVELYTENIFYEFSGNIGEIRLNYTIIFGEDMKVKFKLALFLKEN